MNFAVLDPIKDERWSSFVSHHPQTSIFHHPVWLSVLKEQYGFRTFAPCMTGSNGEIECGMPMCEVKGVSRRKKWISLPFSDNCPPLYRDEHHLEQLLLELIANARRSGIKEIEIREELPGGTQFVKQSSAVIHTAELFEDEQRLFSTFKKTQVQQPILKAQRDGLTSSIALSEAGIEEFYRLHVLTRRRLGVPVQPKNFFHVFYERIISPGLGFVVIVRSGDRCISAGVFGGFGNVLTYKYGASDENALRLRPNNLLLWQAMQEGVRRGFGKFDFGKTDIGNEGLRKFKSGWGAVERPLYYSYYPSVPSGGAMSYLMDGIVGPVLRNSPLFMCRLTGELLYKYFP